MFEELELRLVASLKRNLARHKAWEREEGFTWEAWQSAKLRDLRQYRQDNKKILDEIFPEIQAESGDYLLQEYGAGQAEAQEDIQKLLEEQEQEGGSQDFFQLNNRKMEALLRETQTAQDKVEKACLRYMDDVYRKTILKASTALVSGTMTVRQATDWAVKDFLERGLTCIQYKNGRRVNIATWAEMALRTNSTRAKLLGEAQKRQEMGIDTVLVSQYGACSETCLPWQGKVYIDDVFGVFDGETRGDLGHSRNGKWFPLLSVAVAAGLFHPNCRHTLTTWIEGVSKMPKPLDAQKVQQASKLEEQQRALERKVRKAKRIEAGIQNPEDAKKAQAQVRAAQKELREFVRAHPGVLRRDYWRERAYPDIYLQPQEEKSILKYISGESYTLNAKLRAGMTLEPYEQTMADGLDSALKKMPLYSGAVYRDYLFSDSELFMEFAYAHQVGESVEYPAFTSSSAIAGYNDKYTVRAKIISKTGRDIRKYNPDESEILFQRNSSFRIVKAEIKDNRVYLEMEEK